MELPLLEPVSRNELRDDALKQILRFKSLLSAVPPEEIDKPIIDGKWTPGQLAEHVIRASQGNMEVAKGPVTAAGRAPDEKVRDIRAVFLDFDRLLNSPDFILPKQATHDKNAQLAELESVSDDVVQVTASDRLDQLCTSFALPRMGELTGREWVRFLTYHTQRHARQLAHLLEVAGIPVSS